MPYRDLIDCACACDWGLKISGDRQFAFKRVNEARARAGLSARQPRHHDRARDSLTLNAMWSHLMILQSTVPILFAHLNPDPSGKTIPSEAQKREAGAAYILCRNLTSTPSLMWGPEANYTSTRMQCLSSGGYITH